MNNRPNELIENISDEAIRAVLIIIFLHAMQQRIRNDLIAEEVNHNGVQPHLAIHFIVEYLADLQMLATNLTNSYLNMEDDLHEYKFQALPFAAERKEEKNERDDIQRIKNKIAQLDADIKAVEKLEIPEKDPITLDPPEDPVVIATLYENKHYFHIYDRLPIVQWLNDNNEDPIRGKVIDIAEIRKNPAFLVNKQTCLEQLREQKESLTAKLNELENQRQLPTATHPPRLSRRDREHFPSISDFTQPLFWFGRAPSTADYLHRYSRQLESPASAISARSPRIGFNFPSQRLFQPRSNLYEAYRRTLNINNENEDDSNNENQRNRFQSPR